VKASSVLFKEAQYSRTKLQCKRLRTTSDYRCYKALKILLASSQVSSESTIRLQESSKIHYNKDTDSMTCVMNRDTIKI